MAILSEAQITDKLKPIENKVKQRNNLYREDIQAMINTIIYNVSSYKDLCKYLEDMVRRTGVKNVGIRTKYVPREGLYEVDKTLDFIKDLRTYLLVNERFFYGSRGETKGI
jgi:hypothetical protein